MEGSSKIYPIRNDEDESLEEIGANVIAMVTEGQHGFWDALRGSTVQRVLRHAPSLVFTIPADE